MGATDEWSAAVRALVNTGRKPLAESLGLLLPGELACECEMWALVSKMSRLPHHERAAAVVPFLGHRPPPSPCLQDFETGDSTADCVEFCDRVRRQRQVGGGDVLAQVGARGGARDEGDGGRALQQPGQGDLLR